MSGNSCDKVQVRQVRKIGPTRRSVSGSYQFRGKEAIQYESTLERDFLIRHEFFPNMSLSLLSLLRSHSSVTTVGPTPIPLIF